jgi:pimeloyl-ACP methyl ester carboxylesterase
MAILMASGGYGTQRMAPAPAARPRAVSVDAYGPEGRSAWLDIDWREHQRWVPARGSSVNVIDLGPEEPEGAVVWIHGLSGCWQNWLENLPHVARRYRCVALDLPGFGASPMPPDTISISAYAATVDAVLGELGVERATVVGNSMGGFIGAELAIAFGTWVDRLVLVSAAGLTIEKQRSDPLLQVLDRADGLLALYGGWLASRSEILVRRERAKRALVKVVATHPEKLPGPLLAEQLRGSGKPGFVPALRALTSYPIAHRLERIAAPTLIVWGDSDLLVPVRDAWEFGRLIPGSRVVVYEDTGHVPMLERPAAFNALLDEFLAERRVPGGTP